MQLGLGWIFVGAYAVENGRSIDIALLRATSLYWKWRQTDTQKTRTSLSYGNSRGPKFNLFEVCLQQPSHTPSWLTACFLGGCDKNGFK